MMNEQEIPILDLKPQYQTLKAEIHQAIERVLTTTSFIMGPDVKAFEEEIARYLGVKHAIGVNSGTDALVIGLKAMGIGPGDEVITTPFTFFATAESISSVGAKPVFVDIEESTFNLDPRLIEAKLTSKTKAIMPVHLYGRPANMTTILDIARKNGLQVIEDCAQSFGATYQGRQSGTLGNVGAYSFFPSKNLGAYGDGGLIATQDDKIADISRMLRTHGAKKKYHNEILGFNSRLDTIQAAILRVKLPHIDQWNQERRKIAKTYGELFTGMPQIIAPEVSEGHVFHQYTIRILGGQRDRIHKKLEEKKIGTMLYYPIPQDLLPIYKGQYPKSPVSEMLTGEVISLPIWPEMRRETIERVVEGIKSCL